MFKIILFTFLSVITLNAQEIKHDTIIKTGNSHQFKLKKLVIPGLLIGYGIIGIESDDLKFINSGIKEEVNENIDKKITIDDFSQYAPTLSVYGLNAMGIKGKHNLKDRTILLATSYLIMSASVLSLKSITLITFLFLIVL